LRGTSFLSEALELGLDGAALRVGGTRLQLALQEPDALLQPAPAIDRRHVPED
jgi:hypothetical protein